MTEEEQYQLLAEDGMLVKRPIIVGEDFVLTGFKEKEWEEVTVTLSLWGDLRVKRRQNLTKRQKIV